MRPTKTVVALVVSMELVVAAGALRKTVDAQNRGAGPGRGAAAAPDVPRGIRVKTDRATPGYVLFAPLNSDTTFLIDNDGAVVRTWKSDLAPAGAVYMLDNGSVVRGGFERETKGFSGGGQGGRLQEFSFDGALTWDFTFNDETHLTHHDFTVLPNGHVLAIAWELKSAADARAAGRRDGFVPERGVWPDMLVEIEPQRPKGGRVVWEWHSWDHLIQNTNPSLADFAKPSERPERVDVNGDTIGAPVPQGNPPTDIFHTNAVKYNPAFDQIVLSVPRFNELWVIDHSTTTAQARGSSGGKYGKGGDLLYRWGNPQAYGRGVEADRRLGFQHDTRWIPKDAPGAGHLMVFSNRGGGSGPNAGRTTVYEIAPPVGGDGRYTMTAGAAFGPVEPVWSYAAPDFDANYISGATRLSDGKTMISSGPQGRIFEVTSSGEIGWEYWSRYTGSLGGPQGNANPYALFRGVRIPANHPALRGRTLKRLDPQPSVRSPA
jgi:hypothetical protein